MNDAAKRLQGTHDFVGFSGAGGKHADDRAHDLRLPCRTRRRRGPCRRQRLGVSVCNMVRIVAGTLVDVGRGHSPPSVVDAILETETDPSAAKRCPHGLWLEWIKYDGPNAPTCFSNPILKKSSKRRQGRSDHHESSPATLRPSSVNTGGFLGRHAHSLGCSTSGFFFPTGHRRQHRDGCGIPCEFRGREFAAGRKLDVLRHPRPV